MITKVGLILYFHLQPIHMVRLVLYTCSRLRTAVSSSYDKQLSAFDVRFFAIVSSC